MPKCILKYIFDFKKNCNVKYVKVDEKVYDEDGVPYNAVASEEYYNDWEWKSCEEVIDTKESDKNRKNIFLKIYESFFDDIQLYYKNK